MMKLIKKHLCDLPFCYAASSIEIDGRTKYLLAPDAYGPCYSIDSETFERETVWESPGGTMCMVPLPGKNGDFLAVQRFNPGFQAQNAEIVHLHRANGMWLAKTLFRLPYVHRFDILEREGIYYLLCCTVCANKKDEADWSSPGAIYAAELPNDLAQPIALVEIAGGMTRNHGYCRIDNNNYTSAMTSCDQGIFEIVTPARKGGEWIVRNILAKPISDIALCDIDGDGIMELATIEPFHGNDFVVYRKTATGYSPIYHYPGKTAFCHVVLGGSLRGNAVFIGGCRAENCELFMLTWHKGAIQMEIIEMGVGPSNVTIVHGEERDFVLAANRVIGEGTLYIAQNE
jgi:hypothetical protein